ncbi:MAG TPA: hemolysin family protein [Bacteroidota bacterium]|nr:hemolysin family protein [Bacteroidota bacterium]
MALELYVNVFILLGLLGCSAFFSASEVALFSLHPPLKDERDASVRIVNALLAHPRRLLITILIGNTIVNTGAALVSVMMTVSLTSQFGWNVTVALVTQVVLLTFIIIVVSELPPKVLAARSPLAVARRVAFPLYLFFKVLTPVIDAFDAIVKNVERLAMAGKGLSALEADELRTLVDVGSEEGEIDDEERSIIHNLLDAKDTVVREVMTPRTEMAALEEDDATLDALMAFIVEKRHSRIPVYSDSLDSIRGIIFAKELLPFLHPESHEKEHRAFSLAKYLHQPLFVPESKSITALLKEFRQKKTNVAIAVDEYGGTAGIVTFQDVISGMVGDVGDVSADAAAMVERISETRFRFDAAIDLDRAGELLGIDLHVEETFDTLGGLLLHLFGKIPRKGEQIDFGAVRFTVLHAEKNRINLIGAEIDPSARAPEE